MAERKGDPLPESTWQLMQEFRAAQEEEQRREEEWIKHYNSIYSPAREGEAAPHTVYRIAERMVAQHKRGQLEEAHEDTLRLAQAYLDAIQKRQDAMSIMTAEFAADRRDLLDELNRGL